MNKINKQVINGTMEETIEFHLMSTTLSSINFEDKLTDGQYVAICYFATIHNVTPFEVVGIDGKEGLERYMRSLNDDVDVSPICKQRSGYIDNPFSQEACQTYFRCNEGMTPMHMFEGKFVCSGDDLKSKESDTSDATRKFRDAGIKKASELLDNNHYKIVRKHDFDFSLEYIHCTITDVHNKRSGYRAVINQYTREIAALDVVLHPGDIHACEIIIPGDIHSCDITINFDK